MNPAIPESVVVPAAPPIPGLTFRRFRGEGDYPAIATIINAHSADSLDENRMTPEGVANHYASLSQWDPQADTLFAEVDGLLIGYGSTEQRLEDSGDCLHIIRIYLPAQWRGRGLELAMQRHLERRSRETRSRCPGDARHLFASFASEGYPTRAEALLADGYLPVRHFYDMERRLDEDLPEASLPPGLELRAPRPELYRAIWDANAKAFHGHWGNVVPSEEDYQG